MADSPEKKPWEVKPASQMTAEEIVAATLATGAKVQHIKPPGYVDQGRAFRPEKNQRRKGA